jgi:hypothetical protein
MIKKEFKEILKSHIIIFLLFFPALLLYSCSTEPSQKMSRINPALKSTIVFSGKVLTIDGKPIKSAEVNVNGLIGYTNSKGYFEIEIKRGFKFIKEKIQKFGFGYSVEKDKNRYVLNIRKQGFGLMSKVYHCGVKDGIWRMTKATIDNVDPANNIFVRDIRPAGQQNCVKPLSSQVDWSDYPLLRFPDEITDELRSAIEYVENYAVCNPGISINIPANSLVDSSGNPPQGDVTVALSTVDIYDPYSMPGDYSVIVNGRYRYMQTFGAGTISVTAKDKTYQPKKGSYATLTIPINPSQRKKNKRLVPTIPLLLYDENQGIWTVKGTAKLNEQGNAYIARISHFSAFNMDLIKTDQACIKIDSSGINGNFNLEVIVPMPDSDPVVRTFSIDDNDDENIHVVYNLPSNTDVVLRAFRGGMIPYPITQTYNVHTGAPQDPSTPLCPDYPYTACNSQEELEEYSNVPVLVGFSFANGDVILEWSYHFRGSASSADGYYLEEKIISTPIPSEFSVIYDTWNGNDQRETVQHTLSKTSGGSYLYRVKAYDEGGWTEYSNTVSVDVTIVSTGNPTVLRIVNDLYDGVDSYGVDWGGRLNNIVRVRIGPTDTSVFETDILERLNPYETQLELSNCDLIPPSYNQEDSYRDFDVSQFGTEGYCVFIQTGWWDPWFNPNTFEFQYYRIHDTTVVSCADTTPYGNKWRIIYIVPPFYDPEIIKASEWLPLMHWYGTEFCN